MTKVLIVEDEPDARELLAQALSQHGWSTVSASDGSEGARLFDPTIDVVVTDLVMPGLDGISLLSRIAATRSAAICVVITSFADKDRTVGALNHGAHYLLEKPFSSRQLIDIIARLLGQRQGRPSLDLRAVLDHRLDLLGVSERDRHLITCVLQGQSNREIAEKLNILEQSVKNHLFQTYRRLGVGSRGELFHLVFPI